MEAVKIQVEVATAVKAKGNGLGQEAAAFKNITFAFFSNPKP